MKKILFMSLLLMFTLLQQVTAQNRNISGRVTDRQSGEGLPGVTVLLKGTTNGVSTNSDGTYTLSVPPAGGTLVFSSIGFIQTERAIGTEDQLNIGLAVDSKQLSEVVVTGYGTQERRDVTGSISSVQGEAIANLASPSFAQQLAGRAAGVQVSTPSGLLGQQPRILIRGTNSISSNTFPLVVVDGVPIITGNQSSSGTPNNPLADINPSDIESYEVLKDGSSTAIYGSRAANGVILITTKKGKLGKARISYDTYLGVAETLKRYEVLNADQFVTIKNEMLVNAKAAPAAFPYEANGQKADTDWQDLVFRQGFQQNHALSVAGANEKTSYYFSVGYTDQQGVVKTNSIQRATFRANVDQEVKKWFRVGTSLGLTRTVNNGLNTGANSLSGNVSSALSLFPNVPARNPDGTPYITANGAALGSGSNKLGIANNLPNLLFPLENNVFRATNYRILGNVYGEIEPITGLTLRTQYGTDFFLNDDFNYYDPRHGDGRGVAGLVYQSFAPTFRWNWQNTLSYNKTLADIHKISFVGGVELQKTKSTSFFGQATGLADRFFGPENLVSGTYSTPTVGGTINERGFQSFFGRVNYSLKDRYLLSASVRRDAISQLPEATRDGIFPGGSIGWRVSEEPFFKGLGLGFWNDLKLRASYAVVGNVELGDAYPYASLYGAGKYGAQNGIGYNINGQFGNYNLKWESSNKKDVGLDLGFLDGRIGVTADYYRNDVDGLVQFVQLPLSLGVPGNGYYANIGALRNQGFELSLTTQNIVKEDFTWSTSFNFATNKNRVLETNNNEDILSNYNVTRVGESIGSIYGYEYAGVNPANGYPIYKKQDAAGTLVQGFIDVNDPRSGKYFLYDPNNPNAALVLRDPNDASKANNESSLSPTTDKKVLGNSNPTYFGGLTNTLTYKGFDFEIFARFSGGNKIMNVSRQQLLRQEFLNNGTEILDRWTAPGQNTDVPKLVYLNSDFINQNNSANTRFVEKGDFIRLQNITLGYTLPQSLIGRTGLSRIRVYVQAQNIATITNYSGVDPEVNQNTGQALLGNTQAGIDFNANPQQRVITGGLNVNF
ncbi:TonB-dependent receptor [Hymenobacter sp. BT635]|uniref:TonB-dependent receptor n=1 Tax=Hymenobacter nitidus TaxID=2880929 RepID=A0ABS8AE41_9BACT|nr:TonB-dependent receptor [Hymenobacter nitidus]MCB2378156.1 TonB-dependent receptor [Hymenobacter nitidus]